MSNPWFKFFPTDWRNDPALNMCSLAARGLWIEMLALMHQATPYGHLLVNGQSPTEAQLAVLVGDSSGQLSSLLGELEAAGIFSRTRAGVIYSRKMTRMAKKAAECRKSGSAGGNPKLTSGYSKPGYVYVIGRRQDGASKIGVSVNPSNRLKKIRAQYRGHDLHVLGSIWTEDMGTLEATLHKDLSEKCVGGEWFRLNDSDLKNMGFIADPKGSSKGDPFTQKPEARSQRVGDTNVSLSPGGDDLGFHPVDEVAEAVAAFNAAAKESGWPTIRLLSKARRSSLMARLRDCGGLAGWRDALNRAQASSHCCGQNDRGWVANFDFLTRQSSFAKLMEGNYDDRPAARSGAFPHSGHATGGFDDPADDPRLQRIARLAAKPKASGWDCG